jgi:eukaryotic-like serine/threonine-protein kinase
MTDPVDQTWTPPAADNEGLPSATPRLLTGRYLLEERIASGGMASVWRAHDEVLARTVAVKILHDHLAADDGFRERFRREAVAAAKLAHPNVVGLYDTGADGERVYLVMEFIDGRTLKELISDQGPLPVTEVAAIGEQVARALDYAHSRGLVHRDVKPANILISTDGLVKVTDFGIAKADQADDLTKTGMVLGTAAYVAPEQIKGDVVTGQADQYALAIVLYEALTGQQPFKADTPVATAAQRLERDPMPVRSLRADVPRPVDALLHKALAREPAQRYASCAELADALAEYADDSATAALVTSPPPAQPAPDPPPAADVSFVRSEGRYLVPVLVLLLLAAALVGVGLGTGVLETRGDGFPVGIARPDPAEQRADDPAMELVEPADFQIYDPLGSGDERDEDLPHVFDGDPNTTWRTQLYNSPPFGNLKPGVGFYIDLGAAHELGYVGLRTTTPGVDVELRIADEIAPSPEGWDTVGRVEDAADLLEFRFDDEVVTRYVLVWVTGELPAYQGRYAAEFTQIAIRGAPA